LKAIIAEREAKDKDIKQQAEVAVARKAALEKRMAHKLVSKKIYSKSSISNDEENDDPQDEPQEDAGGFYPTDEEDDDDELEILLVGTAQSTGPTTHGQAKAAAKKPAAKKPDAKKPAAKKPAAKKPAAKKPAAKKPAAKKPAAKKPAAKKPAAKKPAAKKPANGSRKGSKQDANASQGIRTPERPEIPLVSILPSSQERILGRKEEILRLEWKDNGILGSHGEMVIRWSNRGVVRHPLYTVFNTSPHECLEVIWRDFWDDLCVRNWINGLGYVADRMESEEGGWTDIEAYARFWKLPNWFAVGNAAVGIISSKRKIEYGTEYLLQGGLYCSNVEVPKGVELIDTPSRSSTSSNPYHYYPSNSDDSRDIVLRREGSGTDTSVPSVPSRIAVSGGGGGGVSVDSGTWHGGKIEPRRLSMNDEGDDEGDDEDRVWFNGTYCSWSHEWEECNKGSYAEDGVLTDRSCFVCHKRFLPGKKPSENAPADGYWLTSRSLACHCMKCDVTVRHCHVPNVTNEHHSPRKRTKRIG
jgi:Histone H1-like nucleoprotein HC2